MTIVNAIDDVDLERDRSLVLQAQAGDDAAFAALYARYFRRLVRFAGKRVGNPTEAEEIAQEAFTRAYRALPNFGGDRRFYPWLCVITARLCIDSLRREGRCQVGEIADEAMIEHGYERLEKEGDVAKVVEAMGRLSSRHREVLELRERQGWSYHHIAAHYEVSLGTVEALLWRARRALKREYESLGAIALAIPGIRRLAVMWRNGNSGQSAVAASALGTIAVLGMAATTMVTGGGEAAAPSMAALAPHVRIMASDAGAAAPAAATPAAALRAVQASVARPAAGPSRTSARRDPVVQGLNQQDGTSAVNRQQLHTYVGGVGIGVSPDQVGRSVKWVTKWLPGGR